MKKILFIAFVFAVFSSAHSVSATVGGPKYIYDLKYNPADTSLYYTEISESGRGCPPELNKISVTTLQALTVVDCNQTENLTEDQVAAEIIGVTAPMKDVSQIDLGENGISIDIIHSHSEKLQGEDFVIKNHFITKIFQNNTLIGEVPVSGCSRDQAFLFGGYAIPGLNKKMVLVLSAKGDCWEGGYTYEVPFIINAEIINRNLLGNKTAQALSSSSATLVVYEQKNGSVPQPTETNNTPTPTDSPIVVKEATNPLLIALIAAAFLVIGVALGRLIKK